MTQVPGTIHLGKFRLVYEEEREPAERDEGYLLQRRAVIRLNEELATIERPEDYTAVCDEVNFTKAAGQRPSALQYFIASIGFCMFSQLARFAAKFAVAMDDAAIELRMTRFAGQVTACRLRRRRPKPHVSFDDQKRCAAGTSHSRGPVDG